MIIRVITQPTRKSRTMRSSYKAAFKAASESEVVITALSIEPAIAHCPSSVQVQWQEELDFKCRGGNMKAVLSLVIVPTSTKAC